MYRHPTQGNKKKQKNNLHKSGSHQNTVGNETALPKWCSELLGNELEELKGYTATFPSLYQFS